MIRIELTIEMDGLLGGNEETYRRVRALLPSLDGLSQMEGVRHVGLATSVERGLGPIDVPESIVEREQRLRQPREETASGDES